MAPFGLGRGPTNASDRGPLNGPTCAPRTDDDISVTNSNVTPMSLYVLGAQAGPLFRFGQSRFPIENSLWVEPKTIDNLRPNITQKAFGS